MRFSFLRPFTAVTIVAYLLATVGAIGTHNHQHALTNDCSKTARETDAESHSHGHSHHHGHDHHHHHGDSQSHETVHTVGPGCTDPHHHHGHDPHDGDDCSVCKLLSAKTLPTAPVAVVEVSSQVCDVVVPCLESPQVVAYGAPLSRGPPARG